MSRQWLEVAMAEMLRVLKPGGIVAFATWPGEQLIDRLFSLNAKNVPPPQGIASPVQWGDIAIVRQRRGDSAKHLHFERGIMGIPALCPQHVRLLQESKAGPFIRTVLGPPTRTRQTCCVAERSR